jgi:chitinase
VRRSLILFVLAPSSEYFCSQIELSLIPAHLDWVNLMNWDYHGSWEPAGPTNHHAPLYASPADPSAGWSADRTVAGYLAGGVLAGQLVLGVPFFGRGWTRVAAGGNHSLYQAAAGVRRGPSRRASRTSRPSSCAASRATGTPGHRPRGCMMGRSSGATTM